MARSASCSIRSRCCARASSSRCTESTSSRTPRSARARRPGRQQRRSRRPRATSASPRGSPPGPTSARPLGQPAAGHAHRLRGSPRAPAVPPRLGPRPSLPLGFRGPLQALGPTGERRARSSRCAGPTEPPSRLSSRPRPLGEPVPLARVRLPRPWPPRRPPADAPARRARPGRGPAPARPGRSPAHPVGLRRAPTPSRRADRAARRPPPWRRRTRSTGPA